MNLSSKKIFWTLINAFVLVAIFVGIAAAGALFNVKNSAYPTRTITVQGTGKVEATPDIAVFDISVVAQGATEAAVEDESAQKINAVIDTLKEMGVEKEDIQTTSSNIYPRYQYSDGRLGVYTEQRTVVGYEATQSINVTLRDVDKAGEIKSAAVAAGANMVNGPYLQFDDIEVYKSQAREEAFDIAKEKAKVMAKQAGVRLAGVVSFYEDNWYGGPVFAKAYGGDAMMEEAMTVANVEIEPGQEDVQVTVSVTYEIK
ncbi:MAG: SIMPL domain-containing protein [Candidatus Paceibacterota bacterium]